MKRKMIYTIIALLAVFIGWEGYEFWQAVGRQPRGERLARCQQSPQWRDGHFQNVHDTPQLTSDDGFVVQMWKFLFGSYDNLKPTADVPTVKTDLKAIPRTEEVCVWLGHSTVYIQTQGVRFLFDPVLTNKLPVWWFMRPFKGAAVYSPDDIPDVDYLIITHDHWDHLDWKTVTALRPRVRQVACSLGIGEHFEYWGYDPAVIHDLDWHDSIAVSPTLTLRCLPSRHFSGRLGGTPKTLWASYLIDGVDTLGVAADSTATPQPRRIFVSGDGGYDDRFQAIGRQYPDIDLAIMENGQYDAGWRYIHTMPNELPQAISDLQPRRVMTYHNAKYALANHSWTEPLDSIYAHAQGQPWQLLTPRIGEVVYLRQQQTFSKWW